MKENFLTLYKFTRCKSLHVYFLHRWEPSYGFLLKSRSKISTTQGEFLIFCDAIHSFIFKISLVLEGNSKYKIYILYRQNSCYRSFGSKSLISFNSQAPDQKSNSYRSILVKTPSQTCKIVTNVLARAESDELTLKSEIYLRKSQELLLKIQFQFLVRTKISISS